MSNILIEQLPEAVEIGGVEYAVNTDFKDCIRVILAFEDSELTDQEKCAVMLQNLYPEIPDDTQGAVDQALKFLNGGRSDEEQSDETSLRLYSFEKDADFIFAAFRQTHGIDLETVRIHWWVFLALFADLGSETTFCNLIALRRRVKTGTASKEERALARELNDLVYLQEVDTRTPEEREKEIEFMRLVKGHQHGEV
ncbi:MAG: bacteriophage Gp15 family protein [Planctomycetota bacterium]